MYNVSNELPVTKQLPKGDVVVPDGTRLWEVSADLTRDHLA